jgi:hypothetical protein
MGLFDDFTPNADNANTGGDYKPVPEGVYDLLIDSAEAKTTKNGDTRIAMTIVINSGDHEGKKIFSSFMRTHSNPETVAIANKQLDALIILGKIKFDGTLDCFIGAVFKAKVVVKKSEYNGNERLQNEIIFAVPKKGEEPQAAAPAKPSTRPVADKKASW